MADVYDYWRAVLKPGTVASSCISLMIPTVFDVASNDNPQAGIWKTKLVKGGPYVPVRIWLTDDDGVVSHQWRKGLSLACTIDGAAATVDRLEKVWPFCLPVSKADYEHFGINKKWPGEIDTPARDKAASIGDNSGDVSLAEEVQTAVNAALSWLEKTPIKTKVDADMAANYHGRMRELWGKADKERAAKKEPHLKAGQAIDAEYKPLLASAETAGKTLKAAADKWGAEETIRLRKEAAEAARVENERRLAAYQAEQKAAAEAARVKGMDALDSMLDSLQSVPVPEMVKPADVKVQLGGSTGRKATIKEVQVPYIEDYAKALSHASQSPEVMAAVEKICFAQAKAGLQVPGIGFRIEHKS